MKNKIYNIILAILVIALIITIIFIVIKYRKNQIKEKELETVVEEVKVQIDNIKNNNTETNTNNIEIEEIKKEVQVEYKGYNVVGIITIPKLELEYPIIDKTNEEAMKVSITKFWGNDVNDIGNFTMSGHNYMDGTMFGETKKLNVGDLIEMTDLLGRTIKYKIFDKYVIDPNDVKCVNSVEDGTREITLITCTNGRSNRLIIKAREII